MLVLAVLSGSAVAQVSPEKASIVVNGKSGEASVVRVNNRTYIDLESLTRIGTGTLSFRGQQITLTLPGGSPGDAPAASPEPVPPPSPTRLSKNFMMAGIETIAQLREWGSTMAYAIQNNYQVTEAWANGYRDKAASSLRLAGAAATTEADRNALQLLTNEFANVETWSKNLVEAKRSMDTAKYATSPDALRDEPLSQKIITCGRFLGSMLGSAEFSDDASCH